MQTWSTVFLFSPLPFIHPSWWNWEVWKLWTVTVTCKRSKLEMLQFYINIYIFLKCATMECNVVICCTSINRIIIWRWLQPECLGTHTHIHRQQNMQHTHVKLWYTKVLWYCTYFWDVDDDDNTGSTYLNTHNHHTLYYTLLLVDAV